MEHVPRLPDDSVNVSKTHPLKEAAVLVGGLVLLLGGLLLVLGLGVDLAVRWIPPGVELRAAEALDLKELGIELGGESERQQVQTVLDRLSAHWPENPYRFKAQIWASDEPNAAAIPGGWVLVSSGLLEQVESENELALVLGHEIGHFRNRDHLRRLGRGVLYGTVFKLLFGDESAGAHLPGAAVGSLTGRGFGRKEELAADRFALGLVVAEYGHGAGALDFFERLVELPDGSLGLPEYMSTHPGSDRRVDRLRSEAAERGWIMDGLVTPFSFR